MNFWEIITAKQARIIIDIVVTIIVTVGLLKVISTFFTTFVKKIIAKASDMDTIKRLRTTKIVLISVVDVVLIAMALLHILDAVGINIKPILATAGVLGLAVSFGAQTSIEDIICGLALLFEGQLRVGDVVKIQNVLGTVEKINLRFVMLRDFEGAAHYFRNSSVSPVTNYSKDYSYALIEIGVAYKENIRQVIDVITQVGQELRQDEKYKHLITADTEIWGLERFEDSQIVVKFRIRTLPSHQWTISRAYKLALKNKFDELGIEIPFPQRVVTTK